MLRIKSEVDFKKAPPIIRDRNAPQAVAKAIAQSIKSTLRWGRSWAIRETPEGATGQLRGSITTASGRQGPDFRGEVIWTAGHTVEAIRGGPPRRIPLTKLRPWARAVLGVADPNIVAAIQRSIMVHGTPSPKYINKRAHNIDVRLEEALTPRFNDILEKAAERVAKKLEGTI